MQKAIYSTQNNVHYALASRCYCHFTSPIRRYPDLTIHRVLKTILHSDQTDLKELEAKLIVEAEHSSIKEKNSVECERDVDDMKMAEYMQDHIGEIFDGKISGVTSSGMFVRLPNRIEGRVAIDSLNGDYYIADEISQSIIGKRTKKKFRLGDLVKVKVVNASKIESTISFEIVDSNEVEKDEKKEN